MRFFCACAALLFCFACANSSSTKPQPQSDTVFISRELSDSIYHAVYIERNRQHPYFDSVLTSFRFAPYHDSLWSNYSLTKNLRHVPTLGLPKEWILLNSYQNNYYVYYPGGSRRIINDSVFVHWYFEPIPGLIKSITKENNRWTVRYANPDGPDSSETTLNIYLLDPGRQITIWEYLPGGNAAPSYELRIPKERVREYDMVVNHCITQETDDFEFDTLPLASWIRQKFRK